MYRILFIALLQMSVYNLFAVQDSSTKNVFPFHKLILGAETNLKFISSDLNFQKQGFDLGLNLSYYTNNITYFGVFYNQMNDVWNTSDKTFLLDQNTVNISTANFNNLGILGGYRMIENKKFILMPELRIGYGSLAFKTINSEKIETIRMLTFDSRLNFGYKLTKSSSIGLSVSYMIPSHFEKVQYLASNYNLNNASIGVFLRVPLGKNKNQNKMSFTVPYIPKDSFQMGLVKPLTTANDSNKSYEVNENVTSEDKQNSVTTKNLDKNFNASTNFKEKSIEDKIQNSKNLPDSKRNYTLVVASFKFQQNAQRFLNKYNVGSENKYSILYNEYVNKYRVIYTVFESKSNIIQIVRDTRKEFPGTWVLDY